MSVDDEEELTPAERAVGAHLVALRSETAPADRALIRRTVARARWQRAVRLPLRLAGVFVSALGDALRPLLGTRSRGARR
ncbi:MAG TPA: hypothetical protein VGV40_11585 [Solirubrobacteraceae bacterium]|nr:hypothetical protein [Solirubrobacteraceae bacterium]